MRDHRHQRRGHVVAGRRERVHGAERAHGDLACGEPGHERERDLPVEPERGEHVLERAAEHAGEAVLDRRARRRPAAGPGSCVRNHSTIISARMIVPTRCTKTFVRSHRPIARLFRCGQWYSGSSSSSGWYEERSAVRLSAQATAIAATMPGDVEREQHQALAG